MFDYEATFTLTREGVIRSVILKTGAEDVYSLMTDIEVKKV